MRVVFAGTPEFAEVALAQIIAGGHSVPLVLTQPDRPAGRGMKLHPSPVKATALQHHIAVAQPRSLRLDGKYPADALAAQAALTAADADVMVVAAYGLILPQWVLDLPKHGCLNIHASLLPRWRGAAPIHRAIEAGDSHTGVTIMQMDAGLDTGNMLAMERMAIQPADCTATLHDKLAALGGHMMVAALSQLHTFAATPQPAEGITYAHKIEKGEAPVNWAQPAEHIERRMRAFDPFPGATSVLHGDTLKLWRAEIGDAFDGAGADSPLPGTVLAVSDRGITVACLPGSLTITELQRPGGKRLPVKLLLQSWRPQPGQMFSAPAMP